MNVKLFTLLTLLLSTGVSATQSLYQKQNTQQLSIEFWGTHKALQSEHPLRLEKVLKLAEDNQVVLQYPLAITLFDNSDKAIKEATALKNTVLNQMIQYNLVAHPFYKFIQQSTFSPRILSNIDIDKVRLNKGQNPLLTGQLLLSSPKRIENVLYLGNLSKIHTVTNLPGVPLHEQLNYLQEKKIIDRTTFPFLIYPDGKVEHPYQGNWSTKEYYLPPLTIVYFPFEIEGKSEMDENIIKLLLQRRPTSTKN